MPTFVHRFSQGVKCSCQFSDTPDGLIDRSVTWQGRPTKRHLKQYVQWMHTVNSTMAGEYQKTLTHSYHIKRRRWETWIYEDGAKPRCESVSEFGPEMPYFDNSHFGVFNI